MPRLNRGTFCMATSQAAFELAQKDIWRPHTIPKFIIKNFGDCFGLFKFINHVIKADSVFFAVLCKTLDVFGDVGGLFVLADDVVNA